MDGTFNLYQNDNFAQRAADLVSQMTLQQKVSQMVHKSPAIPELNIPSYNWWNEALHGVARAGTATMFPTAIALAATFDIALVKRVADVISTEGRAKYHEYKRRGDSDIYKGLTFCSPNINIFRDPRWGRGQETYGEDPYLTAEIGKAFVRGMQGDHPKYLKTAACAKHFAMHSGPEAFRHEFNSAVSPKDFYETYLFAFKELVQGAQVAAVMGAYNRISGDACCGSKALLNGILRSEWGFDGYVVSSSGAINDFHTHHKVTNTAAESAALAVQSGCDLNCGNTFLQLQAAVNEGLIDEELIDKAVTRLFTTRFKLGLFDDESEVPYSQIAYDVNDCDTHHHLAEEVAQRSTVLLKNQRDYLPLNRNEVKRIAVIGPNAHSTIALEGNYQGTASGSVTVLDGIREAAPDSRIFYAAGCPLFSKFGTQAQNECGFSEAVSAASASDVVIMVLGLDSTIEGEEEDSDSQFGSGDRPNIELPAVQDALLKRIIKTGKPVVLILLSGSCLAVPYAHEHCTAVIQSFYPGALGGRALGRVLFGDVSPSGRLPITFYNSTEDLPAFDDYSMAGRTYKFFKGTPLYPFGYGLSYGKFIYEHLSFNKASLEIGEELCCKVTVRNIGKRPAFEVIEVYIMHHEQADAPAFSLVHTSTVELKEGALTEMAFTITARQMALINSSGQCILHPGKITVFVGGSAPDARSVELMGSTPLSGNIQLFGEELQMQY